MEERLSTARPRRLPVGAEVVGDAVHLRVWAPAAKFVEAIVGRSRVQLSREGSGYFSAQLPDARSGTRYALSLDGSEPLPDPASRFQPEGPFGPSEVVDPSRFDWTDRDWPGAPEWPRAIYELHVGTFTREGTWDAAAAQLPALVELGVDVIELLPVADFPGRFGWGYDGVDLFAPTRLYGRPEQMRRFVDRAHALGLAVMLDVVFNHVGPSGNFLRRFAPAYFTGRYKNEWGEAIDFDGPESGPVRELFIANAGYWVDEFHLDGLRLDATQAMNDASREHILRAITRRVRELARGRRTLLIAENEPQDAHMVRPESEGGFGLDCIWNDDFHHAAQVAATGRSEAYYRDYTGSPQELLSACKRGFLFQGQRYAWQNKRRGEPALDLPPRRFVAYLQNHDQVANGARGLRLHQQTSPGRFRALTALLLLSPQVPLLFQGQDFAADAPFLYFADHEPGLAVLVRKGRGDFLQQFESTAALPREALDAPQSPETFARCKLDLADRHRGPHAQAFALHRDLLALREKERCLSLASCCFDGAVLGPDALCLRWMPKSGADRLLVVNLGRDLRQGSIAEPLLAPPAGCRWSLLFSTEDARYGGTGQPEVERAGAWTVLGESAVLLGPAPREVPDG